MTSPCIRRPSPERQETAGDIGTLGGGIQAETGQPSLALRIPSERTPARRARLAAPAMAAISSSRDISAAVGVPRDAVYWRVEGSLLELSALRQVGFFTWNSQSFAERWRRRTGMALMTLLRPAAYLGGGRFAMRLLYAL